MGIGEERFAEEEEDTAEEEESLRDNDEAGREGVAAETLVAEVEKVTDKGAGVLSVARAGKTRGFFGNLSDRSGQMEAF